MEQNQKVSQLFQNKNNARCLAVGEATRNGLKTDTLIGFPQRDDEQPKFGVHMGKGGNF